MTTEVQDTDATILQEQLGALVQAESPSGDVAGLARCAAVIDEIAMHHIGAPAEPVQVDGLTHLRWVFGQPRVLLIGHYDTVWPLGTVDRWPFRCQGGRATGPGCFDMKAGIVQLFAALSQLADRTGVAILLTADEEVGSLSSQPLLEDMSRGMSAALVLEPSADGALKTARKGVGLFDVEITGRAAHAGLAPESGVNAALEAAQQLIDISRLGNASIGTTVTPTVVRAGTTVNTVPAAASIAVDVRATTQAEMSRVQATLATLRPYVAGATIRVVPRSVRPPMEARSSAELFARAQQLGTSLGLPALEGVAVGGGSDGNFTAALGVPTLDGLGAVGGNAHAEGEWVDLNAMVSRSALLAALVKDLLDHGAQCLPMELPEGAR